jgi:hypothetical protein
MLLGMLGGWTVLVLVGAWIFFMVNKRGWKWPPLIAGMLLMAALYGNFPQLPATVNQAMTNIVNTFTG